jgi:hypothetical protein
VVQLKQKHTKLTKQKNQKQSRKFQRLTVDKTVITSLVASVPSEIDEALRMIARQVGAKSISSSNPSMRPSLDWKAHLDIRRVLSKQITSKGFWK